MFLVYFQPGENENSLSKDYNLRYTMRKNDVQAYKDQHD